MTLLIGLFTVLALATPATAQTPPPPPILTIDVTDVIVSEGDAGVTKMVFNVTLSDSPTHNVRLLAKTLRLGRDKSTARGGLQAGDEQDFRAIRRHLVFKAGATGAALTKEVKVKVLGDLRVEPDETLVLRLNRLKTDDARVVFRGGGSNIKATGTITNDDQEVDNQEVDDQEVAGADGDLSGDNTEDYQLQQQSPIQLQSGTSITVTPTTLALHEGGGNHYTISLSHAPTGTVTVALSTKFAGKDAEDGPTVTFTPTSWDPISMKVWAPPFDAHAGYTYTINHTVSAAGTNYADATADSVSVTVTDTTATLTLADDPATVAEGNDISLSITSDRTLRGVLPVELTLAARSSSNFTAADIPGALKQVYTADFGSTGSTTGTVLIPTSRDTASSEGAEAYSITLTEAKTYPAGSLTNNGYKLGTDVTADGTLNDAASATPTTTTLAKGVTVTPTALTVTEGEGSAFYSIVLDAAPAANADVTVTYVRGRQDDAGYTGGSMTFTTANWNIPQYVRVWTLEDADNADDTVTFTHTVSGGGYNPVSTPVSDVTVTIDDDD